MKNDLTCGVVRDLLPSYVEGMTSDETNAAVEAHLAACPDCAARRDAMTSPAEPAEAAEQSREVDYLKTVKRKSGRRVVIAVLCTLAVMLAGCALKVFVIGTPAQEQDLFVAEAVDENGILRLSISTPSSATAFWGWTVDTADGVADIHARSVLVSPLFPNGGGTVEVPLDGIGEVWLCGRVVWQDGILIQERVARLYEARTPYVGDIPALNHISELARIRSNFGDYTNSLHTSSWPYRWTLEFTRDGWQGAIGKDPNTFDTCMARYAIQLLALVENLDEVGWTYTDHQGEVHSGFITVKEANALLPELTDAYNQTHAGCDWRPLPSVKSYYNAPPAELQRLVDITQISS